MKSSQLLMNTVLLSFGLTACGAGEEIRRELDDRNITEVSEKDGYAQANEQMKLVLDQMDRMELKHVSELGLEEARAQASFADAVDELVWAQGIQIDRDENIRMVRDRNIIGHDGAELPARFYFPEGSGPFPLIVYYHGGGFVLGNTDIYDDTPRALAKKTGAIVMSVDYRLAPENKFPAAHDDAYAAYIWALDNAVSIGANPDKIAVAGESAGANLAINTSIKAREEGEQAPVHQLLINPLAGSDLNTRSYREYGNSSPLSRADMEWFFDHYLENNEQRSDKRINVVEADLSRLPNTTLITAEIDVLRSEGELLARRLESAGVQVQSREFSGVTHNFFGMAAIVDQALEAQEFAADALKKDLLDASARNGDEEDDWEDQPDDVEDAVDVRDGDDEDDAEDEENVA
jgi:acetyl esterase